MGAINIQAVIALIEGAEETALEIVAAQIVADARARAPVRKVFKEAKGFRRKFRGLTTAERGLAVRRAIAYYTSFGYRRRQEAIRNQPEKQKARTLFYLSHAELRRRGSANNLANSRALRMTPGLGSFNRNHVFTPGPALRSGSPLSARLTSRGRYEARSGRAIHEEVLASGAIRLHIGGALKASIESEGVVQSENGLTVKVTAGVPYAKFVEFPTTHNAAQPFLLPALHGARGKLKSVLAAEIRKAFGG